MNPIKALKSLWNAFVEIPEPMRTIKINPTLSEDASHLCSDCGKESWKFSRKHMVWHCFACHRGGRIEF